MKYIQIRFRFIFLSVIFLLLTTAVGAQVNPGDADNNGIVDNHDILYVGYAFGAVGPRRTVDTLGDVSTTVNLYWEEFFPTGQNYVFADADGNGIVDWEDFLEVFQNYGERFHDLRETAYPEGNPSADPLLDLQLEDSTTAITEGSAIEIPLFLGDELRPVNDFNGLAFSIDFNPEYIREIRLEVDSNSWVETNQGLFSFQTFSPLREGALDVALTRIGQDPVSGFGKIGTLSIIVEDDLVDFKPFEKDSIHTFLHLNGIELIDVDFSRIPLVGTGLKVTIINPNLLSSVDPILKVPVEVYPNPVADWLRVECSIPIQCIELWDLQGRLLFKKNTSSETIHHLSLPNLPKGIFMLKVITSKGILPRKIIH